MKKEEQVMENGEAKTVAPLEVSLTEVQKTSLLQNAQIVGALEQQLQEAQARQQEVLTLVLDAHEVKGAKNVEVKDNKLIITL